MMIEKMEKGENLTIDYIGDHIHEKLEIDIIYGEYEYEIDDKFNVDIIGSIKGKITIEATYKIIGENAVITVTAKTEDEKGIKRIILPNNEEDGRNQKELTIEYRVNSNGEYKFIAEGNNTRINVGESVIATVEVSDDQSVININNCFWILNSSSEEIGMESEIWKNANKLNALKSTISLTSTTVGKRYLHILSCDNANNKKESISEGILFVGEQEYLNIPEGANNWIFDIPTEWNKTRI